MPTPYGSQKRQNIKFQSKIIAISDFRKSSPNRSAGAARICLTFPIKNSKYASRPRSVAKSAGASRDAPGALTRLLPRQAPYKTYMLPKKPTEPV